MTVDGEEVPAAQALDPYRPKEKKLEGTMTPQGIVEIVQRLAGEVAQSDNLFLFTHNRVEMALVMDPTADRMRLVAPIVEIDKMPPELLPILMQANFHTALDARYAMSEGIVYAAYLHPLSPLTEKQVESAMDQVASLVETFGSSFSSTEFTFGG